MQLERYTDPALFRQDVEAYLLRHEAENNLIFGLTNEIVDNERRFGDRAPMFWRVTEGDEVRTVALQTPPHNIVLSYPSDRSAVDLLAEELHRAEVDLPGVTGPTAEAEAFSLRWEALSGRKRTKKMAQRIYKLSTVTKPKGVPGRLRVGVPEDIDLIVSWFKAFNRETLPEPEDEERTKRFTDSLFTTEDRRAYLWEDREPVSMALHTGPTPNGIRVGVVYTPPDKRRKGYATACVAEVSQLVLDSGRTFCFLYTDLANPTSNHIYMEIGYEPVCDSDMWSFTLE